MALMRALSVEWGDRAEALADRGRSMAPDVPGRMKLTIQAEQGQTWDHKTKCWHRVLEREDIRGLVPRGEGQGSLDSTWGTYSSEMREKVALDMRWRAVPNWGR